LNKKYWIDLKIVIATLIATLFMNCSSSPRFHSGDTQPDIRKNKRYFAAEVPQIDTLRNLPTLNNIESVTGLASFYADKFDGRQTANGETYNMYELTAAHKTYPFNTMIRVINLANDKTVIVRINDRGPFVEDRIIDLSLGAAIQLDMANNGVQEVRLEILEWGID